MRKQHIFLFLLIAFCTVSSYTAKAQPSIGGTPPSFARGISRQSVPNVVSLPVTFDVNALRAQDKINEEYGMPPRVAVKIPVNFTVENSGAWTVIDGQKVWQLTLEAKGALALTLLYDEFALPAGGRLFIYNEDHSHVLGAYTNANNPNREGFATELLAGDKLTLEYVAPAGEEVSVPRIHITEVGYAYNNIKVRRVSGINKADFGNSAACMIDINCPEGADWQTQKRGVARILFDGNEGMGWCSGSLINSLDTTQKYRMFFLTAWHCFMNSTADHLNKTIFYFNYENKACGVYADNPNSQTLVGARSLVTTDGHGGSDGELIELNEKAPLYYQLYWNGWDAEDKLPDSSGVSIHHPMGDVKKISRYDAKGVQLGNFVYTKFTTAIDANFLFRYMPFKEGQKPSITQGGSSGGPLFDGYGRIIGTLTGGNYGVDGCDYIQDDKLRIYYGRMAFHYDRFSGKMMKTYLDPLGTGKRVCNGLAAPDEQEARIDRTTTVAYVGQVVQFLNHSYLKNPEAATYKWYFDAENIAGSDPTKGPAQATIMTTSLEDVEMSFLSPGVYSLRLEVTTDEGILTYPPAGEKFTIGIIEKGDGTAERDTIGDLYAPQPESKTAYYPFGAYSQGHYSVALYTPDEISNRVVPLQGASAKAGYITELAWYADTTADYRTYTVYLAEWNTDTLARRPWVGYYNTIGTLACQQSFVASKGWNTFKLTTPFYYSGEKPLMVIVKSKGPYNIPLSMAYSTKTKYNLLSGQKKHLTIDGLDSDPVSNLLYNDRRPVIRLGFHQDGHSALPKADFTLGDTTLFYEDFELKTMHDGWQMFNSAGTDKNRGWTIESAFTQLAPWIGVNAPQKPSYVLGWTQTMATDTSIKTRPVDDWAIMPPVAIPSSGNYYLTFYKGNNGTNAHLKRVSCYIAEYNAAWTADDYRNPAKWTQIWVEADTVHAWGRGYVWVAPQLDIPASFYGKTIVVAWRLQREIIANSISVKIQEPAIRRKDNRYAVTVNEKETVRFTDRSEGPASSWKWTILNASNEVVATSTQQNWNYSFTSPGEYNVSLEITTAQGPDNITKNKAIKVLRLAPGDADFMSLPLDHYIRYIPDGQDGILISPMAPIKLLTMPNRAVDSLKWELPGSSNPLIARKSYFHLVNNPDFITYFYPSGKNSDIKVPEFHDVSLTAYNNRDEDSVRYHRSNYVQIGGSSWIWNVPEGDKGDTTLRINNYNITGTHNAIYPFAADDSLGIYAYGERFAATQYPMVVDSVAINFNILRRDPNCTDTVAIGLTQMTSMFGEKEVFLSVLVKDLKDGWNYFSVADFYDENGKHYPYMEIPTGSAPFISFWFDACRPGYDIAIRSSAPYLSALLGSAQILRKYSTVSPGFAIFSNVYPDPGAVSLAMRCKATYSDLQCDETVIIGLPSEGGHTRNVQVSSNVYWTVRSNNSWIELEDKTYFGNESFTIRCKENTSAAREGVIYLEGGGHKVEITIQQLSGAPLDLVAYYNPEAGRKVDLMWSAPKASVTEPIYDDVESYEAFEIDPSGEIGWTFVDRDGKRTYGIMLEDGTAVSYPHKGETMAFQVFNPKRTTPPIFERISTSMKPRSGDQCFISIASNNKITPSNDWIISPKLNFEGKFRFAFYAKTMFANGGAWDLERIRVLYSKGTPALADFKPLTPEPSIEVPEGNWSMYVFDLDPDVKYVAINKVSSANAFVFMLDDIYIVPFNQEGQEPVAPAKISESATMPVLPENVYLPAQWTGTRFATDSNNVQNLTGKTTNKTSLKFQTVPEQTFNLLTTRKDVKKSSVKKADNPVEKLSLTWATESNQVMGAGGTALNYVLATKFLPRDLISYNGGVLTEVNLGILERPQKAVLKVWEDGVVVRTQPIVMTPHEPGTAYEYTKVILDEPLVLNTRKELMIGCEIQAFSLGQACFAFDGLNRHQWYGDLYADTDEGPFYATGIGSWLILATVEREDLGIRYALYRNGSKIKETTLLTHTDSENLPGGEVCYTARTIYEDDTESYSSNQACVTLKYPLHVKTLHYTRPQRKPNPIFELVYELSDFQPGHDVHSLEQPATTAPIMTEALGTHEIVVFPGKDSIYDFITQNGALTITATIPTVFTPNGDGINDVFMDGYQLTVFNRTGIEIYKGTTPTGWDGKDKGGKDAVAGIYYYVATGAAGKTIKGSVELVR